MITEYFNMIFNIKTTYKCMVYVDDKRKKDKLVDVFEIKDYSEKRAYLNAFKMLKLKYPDMGLDIRIFKNKK